MFMPMESYDSHTSLTMFDHRTFKKAFDQVKTEALNNWTPTQNRFTPYSFEGGTVGAIAGDDFVVIGGDTRMSMNGSVVQTRHCEKVFKFELNSRKMNFTFRFVDTDLIRALKELDGDIILASTGFYGDLLQLVRVLRARMKVYQFTYNEPMNITGAAEMLSRTLYYKRFFPYYTANLLAGIDSQGKGALYNYDPVGTIGKKNCSCQGSGTSILQPFLDNQVSWANKPESTRPPMTVDRAKKVLRDGLRAVTERETSTGDAMYLITIAAGKRLEEETVPLRGD